MRPAHKLLKRLLRHRVWEIAWRQTPTGTLRADLRLPPRSWHAASGPPHPTAVSPLTWLAWHDGHLDTPAVTPSLTPALCAALGLAPQERRYFLRHCRAALARLYGLRAADKARLLALGAGPPPAGRAQPSAVCTPPEARGWTVQVIWSHRPDLPPATYYRFQQAVAQTQRHMRLLDFQPEMQRAPAHAFLAYDPAWPWYCDGPEPALQAAYAGLAPPRRFPLVRPGGCRRN